MVGITGVGIFLGANTPTLDAMTRHLEHAVDLVGLEHVGVSTDSGNFRRVAVHTWGGL